MRLDSFDSKKRADLQKLAYGKVYVYCSTCYRPLIPTSFTPDIASKSKSSNQFIPCCTNGSIPFAQEAEIIKLMFKLTD